MNKTFLAGVIQDDPLPGFSGLSPAMQEFLILSGAFLLVAAMLLAWAYYTRKKRRRAARRAAHRQLRRSLAGEAAKGVAGIAQPVKHREGRRRRRRRPRNPTLAETGGLPPLRGSGEAPPNSPS